MVRCFEARVIHVENSVDPIRDTETVETELMLADLESLEKRYDAAVKKAKGGDKEAEGAARRDGAGADRAARGQAGATVIALAVGRAKPQFKQLQLLTGKPVLYVCNVEEGAAATGNAYSKKVEARAKAEGAVSVVISAAIEAEVAAAADGGEGRVPVCARAQEPASRA